MFSQHTIIVDVSNLYIRSSTAYTICCWNPLDSISHLILQYFSSLVVTGSTDGIGREYAKELAQRGINIVLIARNESKLIDVSKEIGKYCCTLHSIQLTQNSN